MTRDEHIEKAEQLLESAKDVARQKKPESDVERRAQQDTMFDLLAFANCHANIARARAGRVAV